MTQSLKRQRVNDGGGLDGIRVKIASLVRSAAAIDYDYPDPSRVLGIDVHQYSGVVDWEAAKAGGIKFALIKAANGLYESPYFRQNWDGARKAGMLRGAWMWLYPASCISPGAQARKLLDLLGDDIGEIRPQIDYEWSRWNGAPANPDASDLYGAMKPIEDAIGKKPIVYSAPGYLIEHRLVGVYWQNVDLWVANYGVMSPMIYPPFLTYRFWQWTDTGQGTLYGVSRYSEQAVDLNYFNGTLEQLYAYAGALPPAEETGEPMTITETGTVKGTANVNVRRGTTDNRPNYAGTIVGAIRPGQVVSADASAVAGDGDTWRRVALVNDAAPTTYTNGWVAGRLLNWQAVTVTPPPPPPPADLPSFDVAITSTDAEVASVTVNGVAWMRPQG